MANKEDLLRGEKVEELLKLFGEFVRLANPDVLVEMQRQQQCRLFVQDLCRKASQSARSFATMILESVNVESEIQEATVESQEATVESIVPGEGSAPSVERRGPSQKDSSYYPPKSAKANRPSANRNSLRLAGLSPLDTDSDMPETQVSAGERNPSHSDKVKESLPDSASGNVSASTPAATCIAETEETSGFRTEPQCDIEQARQRPAGSATRAITSQIEDPGRLAPSTPVRDLGTVSSPRTEEIPREKIPTSLESTPSSPIRSVSRSPIEIDTVRELMLEAIPIIHSLSMHQRGLQPEVYKRILQTVKIYQDEASPIRTQWSDGSTWKRILRAGRSESKQVSMLNMLEYMGASAWYEDQIDLAQEMIRTKKNQPVDRKGATIYVLNRIQSEETVWGHGKCIKSVDGHRTGVVREVDKEERKHITMQLSRGKKLRTRLVKELSLGILFSSKIWKYTKLGPNELDDMIEEFQADPQRIGLLRALGDQLEYLVEHGGADIHSLLLWLKTEGLVLEEEHEELRERYALDEDAMPNGLLNTAVDHLVNTVSINVLGKRRLESNDVVAICDSNELGCDIFEKLRQGEWLDAWTIYAGMTMSDRPPFVKYGYSIPLDEPGRDGKLRAIRRPLLGWRKQIEKWREAGSETDGEKVRQVYLCPLNHNNSHFSLLEINEIEQKIFHYDSKASRNMINGTMAIRGTVQLTRVGKLVQDEFSDLGFEHVEAPTPQQTDDTSCGVRVIANYSLRAQGFSVGGWSDLLDPERLRMELVGNFQICIADNAMRKGRDREELRRSKRLKTVAE